MSIKSINIFQSKAPQNLPKLGFFGLKTNHLATLRLFGLFTLTFDEAAADGGALPQVQIPRFRCLAFSRNTL
jgi:hypothetical protein